MNSPKVTNENSSNPKKGRRFQELSAKLLGVHFNVVFDLDVKIHIGKPSKEHAFDLVSKDGQIIVECKRYTWTKGGNPPSAKFATLNEAVFYQTFLKGDKQKFIVMAKVPLPNSTKTLADYYYEKFGSFLRETALLEIDERNKRVRRVSA